jgi:hypothetical protein
MAMLKSDFGWCIRAKFRFRDVASLFQLKRASSRIREFAKAADLGMARIGCIRDNQHDLYSTNAAVFGNCLVR